MTSETIADIVADLKSDKRRFSNSDSTAIACRIEAAAKRMEQTYLDQIRDAINQWGHEKYKAEHASVGNAAAMREALNQVSELNDLWFDTFTLPDGATSIHDEIEDVISAALAVPPRNCDVPHKDGHELWLRWQAYCAEIYPSTVSFSTWLIAIAKEGGAK